VPQSNPGLWDAIPLGLGGGWYGGQGREFLRHVRGRGLELCDSSAFALLRPCAEFFGPLGRWDWEEGGTEDKGGAVAWGCVAVGLVGDKGGTPLLWRDALMAGIPKTLPRRSFAGAVLLEDGEDGFLGVEAVFCF
jgi:hypothetical protein